MCTVRQNAEQHAIACIAARLARDIDGTIDGLSTICIPHFAMLAAGIDDRQQLSRLVEFEAANCERFAEDMRRFALKHDATRRFLVSDEEALAPERGLMFVAGHKRVNATAKVR